MTKDSKLSHISDSASGGKGESMARETRFQTFAKNYYGFRRQWSPAETKEIADFAKAYAESECSRLASRVEELEQALREIALTLKVGHGTGAAEGCRMYAEKLLAGAHAEEKPHG